MKTTTIRSMERHGKNLANIFGRQDLDPIELYKQVRRIEQRAHRMAEDYCNGVYSSEDWEKETDRLLGKLDKILGFRTREVPVFVNGDPRGYALKIREKFTQEKLVGKIATDFGGYGILAPDPE